MPVFESDGFVAVAVPLVPVLVTVVVPTPRLAAQLDGGTGTTPPLASRDAEEDTDGDADNAPPPEVAAAMLRSRLTAAAVSGSIGALR
jgi:hypothetical protein